VEHIERLDLPADHAAYAGHFPGAPILPGVVLLDAALHAVAHAVAHPLAPAGAWRIDSAKFFAPVRPGDRLELAYACTGPTRLRFEIRGADGRTFASGVISHVDGS